MEAERAQKADGGRVRRGTAMAALGRSAAGCGARRAADRSAAYLGVETALLDGDLVNFRVTMTGARGIEDVERYAACAAAQYALIRGYGFARHVRTLVR